MKKIVAIAAGLFMWINCASAQKVSYIEETQALGSISGQGLACNASKYHTYEMLARAILVSKAKSDEQQLAGMKSYNDAKANSFVAKMKDGLSNCRSIAKNFDNQQIYKMVLYGNGTIKMPDGSIITPRQEYDPTLVYNKDAEERQKYIDMYRKQSQKAQNDPAFKRAMREYQMKNGF